MRSAPGAAALFLAATEARSAGPAATEADQGGTPLADFETGPVKGLDLTGWEASADSDAAVGRGALRLTPRGRAAAEGTKAAAWLPVQGWNPAKVSGLTIWLRARSGEKTVAIRLVAADGEGRQFFQRRVEVRPEGPAGRNWQH